MASRRKSTTPCMVPARDGPEPEDGAAAAAEEEPEEAAAAAAAGDPGAAEGGYECKYCSFQTSELNLFTMHVDAEHPDVVLNASYVCVECDYHTKSYDALLAHNARLHPGEDGFTRTLLRRNGEAVLQQTVSDLTFDGGFVKTEAEEAEEAAAAEEEDDDSAQTAIALSKTPIMRIRGRPEPKRFCSLKAGGADDVIKLESDEDEENEENREPPAAAAAAPRLLPLSAPLHLQAVPQNLLLGGSSVLQVKGGGGGAGGVLPPGTLAQVLTALQNQQNQQNQSSQTQLLIPVSSIPSYNSAMDNNLLLLSAYSRFPYPSLSEILGLSSQTKFSEEQIKVWFSAQRLKHGVSWTPEEVEEARRKKFNGTVQTVPPTITVIPANMAAAAANGLQSIFQTCQIVGQPGLVLTQVAGGGAAVPVAPPITLTVAGVSGARPKAAEPSVSESRAEPCTAAAPPDAAAGGKPKKSKEQLAELKASYGRRQFASEAEISRLMQVTKLSKRAIKKWFSDTRYNQRNSRDHGLLGEAPGRAASGRAPRSAGAGPNDGAAAAGAIVIDSSDDAGESSSPTSGGAPGSSVSAPERRVKLRHAFPDFTPQRFKEKTAEQLLLLEASFLQADTPSDEELSRLRAQTKLTRREVDAWFTERRKAPAASGEADGDGPPAERRSGGGGRRAVKRTPEQLNILRTAFIRTQWPTAAEYDAMAEQSGLPRHDIVSWFGDTRYAWKNNSLKWYYLYQIGKVDEALNGGSRTQKKSRKRFRGWSRRSRRPYPCKRSPAGGAATIKVKPGKSFLKDYYLKHGFLSESDLDELVTKSSMSYQQVRDWFSETARRAQDGRKLFSEDEEDGDKEDVMDQEEAEGQRADGDGVMEVKEQGDEEEEVQEDEEVQEEVREDEEVQEHSEGVGQSQSEEQT
ncbi:zinc fingers and homeoboxes protein 1-like isoform X2 [Salarias fasciatus]|uniref:zinc fingers and homeoboxes protein 1-like isoform X2 n=1 Tax=Salarias fasciatus TaxID=181472 RepID=UPI0011767BC7|nr:zinc fingers and homeoboxes protein 1-like isoform X2 [Salarias fasciatus]